MIHIVGFGNPLLDIIVKLNDNTILQKYNIKEDDEKEETAATMNSLLEDISHLNPIFAPGGCSQNTLRVLQWILNTPNSTTIIGAVGRDKEGDILEKLIRDAGVHTHYYRKENHPTGSSVVLIKGIHRALIAHTGAAQHINLDDIQCEESLELLENANLVYVEGFFVSHRVKLVERIITFCNDKNIPFAFNLCGVYMIKNFPQSMWEFAQTSDILFGNRREYETLINNIGLTISVENFVKQLCKDYKNRKNTVCGKIVIVTNGQDYLMCAHSGGTVEVLDVPKIDNDRFKDSNGAGDAFAAGFLAGLLLQKEPLTSMKWGCWVAQQIIQQRGCTIPHYSADILKEIH